MAECNHDCGSCSQKPDECGNNFRVELNGYSSVKKVYGVVSGKGGVGKSLVTSLLACATAAAGKKTAIMDADITGPSIPKAFGLTKKAESDEMGLLPETTGTLGIEVMSINLLLDDPNAPVVWRGPVISGVIKQFWTEVVWGDVDYMFVDMPPGTGDVPLTVFQSLPIDGIIIVTTPQDLVSMIVTKAYNMAKMMNIPVVGIIENMSYVQCPDCGKKIEIFGQSKAESIAKELGTELLARIPIDPKISSLTDSGSIELADTEAVRNAVAKILK